jgi:hypothetical protein
MYKNITPDYYGYRDDDDGVLMEKEAKREVGSIIRYTSVLMPLFDILFTLLHPMIA